LTIYFIALGSNLGDRRSHLSLACERLRALGQLIGQSSIYATAPMYLEEQPEFFNAVVCLESPLGPDEMLQHLQQIETAGGRVRQEKNGPRTIDLDIVDAGVCWESDALTLPHPRLAERPFVVFPLAELAPTWIHPLTGVPVGELKRALAAPTVVVAAPW
jgi:2-amino-4-hydroxy-6-hydroxymethyldihydropteridine diphosphokinase